MSTNNIQDYTSDYVIKDISSSVNDFKQYSSLPNTPIVFTIDGPLSLKGTSSPYEVTVSK